MSTWAKVYGPDGVYLGCIFRANGIWFAETPMAQLIECEDEQDARRELRHRARRQGRILRDERIARSIRPAGRAA